MSYRAKFFDKVLTLQEAIEQDAYEETYYHKPELIIRGVRDKMEEFGLYTCLLIDDNGEPALFYEQRTDKIWCRSVRDENCERNDRMDSVSLPSQESRLPGQ